MIIICMLPTFFGMDLDLMARMRAIRRIFAGSLSRTNLIPIRIYLKWAIEEVDSIHARGKRAIIEGCHFGYVEALLGHYGTENVLRLTFDRSDEQYLSQSIRHKFRRLVAGGLYFETEQLLINGYRDAYPMTSLIYGPIIDALEGRLTDREAEDVVVRKWTGEVYRTDAKLARLALGTCAVVKLNFQKPEEEVVGPPEPLLHQLLGMLP